VASTEPADGPPTPGDRAPEFEALLCDGETFRARSLSDVVDRGCVLVFYGFAFSAISYNWWKRYDRRGWDGFPVPVLGVCRDGPYAQNAFLREVDSPFRSFSDLEGSAIDAYGLLTERTDMAGVRTARRAVYVLGEDREVLDRWIVDDWISPMPAEEIETTVERQWD